MIGRLLGGADNLSGDGADLRLVGGFASAARQGDGRDKAREQQPSSTQLSSKRALPPEFGPPFSPQGH